VDQARAGIISAKADTKQVVMRQADSQGKSRRYSRPGRALEAAQLNIEYTTLLAPVDGVVTHKQVEVGQIVQQGQGLMVIVPLQDVWVTANFKETQLRAMKPGQKVEVKVDTYGKTFFRARGFDCRSNRGSAEFVAAGKCHGELRKGSAARAGKNRAGSDSTG